MKSSRGGGWSYTYLLVREYGVMDQGLLQLDELPIENWHDYIGDPTLADAILDRLVHSAHKIHIEGETMRKRAAADKQNTGLKPKTFD